MTVPASVASGPFPPLASLGLEASDRPNTADSDHERKFHCTPCKKFLPETSFFPSNLRRHIHRCRMHTREASMASQRKHAAIAKQRKKATGVHLGVRSWRKVARRVITLMRSKHSLSSSASSTTRSPGHAPPPDLPDWLSDIRVVAAIVERFEGQSALSGQKRGLVLVPYAHLTSRGAHAWETYDSVLVTCGEAAILASQTSVDREEAFGERVGGTVMAARKAQDM